MDSEVSNEKKKPEKIFHIPRSAVVVFSTFMASALNASVLYTFNIYYVIFLEEFHSSRSLTAWVGSIYSAMFLLAGPISSRVINYFGCRTTMIVGGIGAAGGFIITSFARNICHLLFSLGFITAIFLSFVYVSRTVALSLYCKKYFSIATGIAFSGSGFGLFAFSPLIQFLVDYYGWRGAMVIQAGIALNMCVCGSLLYTLEPNVSRRYFYEKHDSSNKPTNCFKLLGSKLYSSYKFIKKAWNNLWPLDVKFLLLSLSNSLWVMASFTVFVTNKDISSFRNWADKFYIILQFAGLSDIIGRLTIGVLSSIFKYHILIYSVSFHLISAGAAFLLIISLSFEMFIAFNSVFSFCYAAQSVILALAPAAMYGNEQLSEKFGALLFACGCGTLLGPPIGGFLMDTTKDPSYLLLFAGLSCLASSFLVAIVFCLIKIKINAKSDKNVNQLSLENESLKECAIQT